MNSWIQLIDFGNDFQQSQKMDPFSQNNVGSETQDQEYNFVNKAKNIWEVYDEFLFFLKWATNIEH